MLSANLDIKVKDLLGNSDYNTHKNLITHIFSNEDNFYTKKSFMIKNLQLKVADLYYIIIT